MSPQALSLLPWMMCIVPGAIYLDLGASDPVFLASLTATLIVHVLHHRRLQRRPTKDGGPLEGVFLGAVCVVIWAASHLFGFELTARSGTVIDPGFLLPTGVLQLCLAGIRWAWTEAMSKA